MFTTRLSTGVSRFASAHQQEPVQATGRRRGKRHGPVRVRLNFPKLN
jgi:hypothetical protein